MIADVVVVLDGGVDLPFEIAGQIVVLRVNAVLQGLVPALDLSLSSGDDTVPRAQVRLILEPFGSARHVR